MILPQVWVCVRSLGATSVGLGCLCSRITYVPAFKTVTICGAGGIWGCLSVLLCRALLQPWSPTHNMCTLFLTCFHTLQHPNQCCMESWGFSLRLACVRNCSVLHSERRNGLRMENKESCRSSACKGQAVHPVSCRRVADSRRLLFKSLTRVS